jgi:antitoxin ParD1/3/4
MLFPRVVDVTVDAVSLCCGERGQNGEDVKEWSPLISRALAGRNKNRIVNGCHQAYTSAMARQTTLNVSLTTPLRNYVHSKVRSGQYESASEVIRDSLRALQERETIAAAFWGDVRKKVAEARQQVSEGKTVDGERAMDDILNSLHDESPAPLTRRRRAR